MSRRETTPNQGQKLCVSVLSSQPLSEMAARLSESELNYSCPICRDIFKDPVLLTCSHSFCKGCLRDWWAEKLIRECPVCKRRSSKSDPPRNLALKNLCEAFVQDLSLSSARCEALCSLHSEKLKLFCLDHKQPVCVVCRDSKTHIKHRFRPIDKLHRITRRSSGNP